MLRKYTRSFSEAELDFLKFHEHKNVCVGEGVEGGGGGKIPRPGYLHPHPLVLDMPCSTIPAFFHTLNWILHKNVCRGGGQDTPAKVSSSPHSLFLDMLCSILLRLIK